MGPGRRAFTRPFRALRSALVARDYEVVHARDWHGQEEQDAPTPGDADVRAEGSDGLPPAA